MELQKFFDDTNGVLICPLEEGATPMYSHNASRPFKSASVIKTFVLAYYLAVGGDLDREIELPRKSLIGTSIMTELKITKATVRELLIYMMGFSDNSATNALFADAGFDALNSFCKNVLGTKQTIFGRKMLDYKAIERGEDNLICLDDCLKAMRFVISHPIGRDIMRRHKGVERIVRYVYDPEIEYYGKSGSIPDVYNDIAVLRRPGGDYVFAGVLSYKCDSAKIKRLMGCAGLAALGAERPVV